MTTIIATLVTAEQASRYGFNIAGTHAYLWEVKGVMVGVLGPKDTGEPGFQFDTVTQDLKAFQLSTDEASTLVDCKLNDKIDKIIRAIRAIVKATSVEHTATNLEQVFLAVGLERV